MTDGDSRLCIWYHISRAIVVSVKCYLSSYLRTMIYIVRTLEAIPDAREMMLSMKIGFFLSALVEKNNRAKVITTKTAPIVEAITRNVTAGEMAAKKFVPGGGTGTAGAETAPKLLVMVIGRARREGQ